MADSHDSQSLRRTHLRCPSRIVPPVASLTGPVVEIVRNAWAAANRSIGVGLKTADRVPRCMNRAPPEGLFQKVARVVVAALLSASVAVPVLDRSPAVADAAPATVEALLIGDSVLNGLAQPYSAAGRAALAARHSFILDSAGCRRLITTSCRIPPGSAPTNAITVLRARAGQYDRALVIAAGYDDPSSGEFGVGAAVDVMLAEARRQGIAHVIWLTYREAGGAANVERFRQSNAVLRSRTDPELVIADWATRSAAMPPSWFSADGIHLGAQASAAMGELIGDTLDALVPLRCTNGESSGTEVPTGVANTTSTERRSESVGAPRSRRRHTRSAGQARWWTRADRADRRRERRGAGCDRRGRLGDRGRAVRGHLSHGVPVRHDAPRRVHGQRRHVVDRRQLRGGASRQRVIVCLRIAADRRARRCQRLDRARRSRFDSRRSRAIGRHATRSSARSSVLLSNGSVRGNC